MSKQIVSINKENWQTIQSIAPIAQASRMFGVTEEQAAIIMLKGHELGLGMVASFEFIRVIDNKPAIAPKGALALIHQAKDELAELEIEDITDANGNPTRCRVYMRRNNGFEYTVVYSMDDAEQAGLVKDRSSWDKYPANMLRWRAVGYCADIVFPDIIGGLYRPEELGADVDQNGEPIIEDGVFTVEDKKEEPKNEPVEKVSKPDKDVTVQSILDAGFTAEQIMVANEGRIPSSSDECKNVLEKLEAGDE